jgi:hypothetical protein
MGFKSARQRRFFFANLPPAARKWHRMYRDMVIRAQKGQRMKVAVNVRKKEDLRTKK